MASINTNYLNSQQMTINNLNDFYSQGLPEVPVIKNIYNAIKVTFKVSDTGMQVSYLDGRVYKFEIRGSGSIYYIHTKSELHFYNDGENTPFLVSKKKKVISSNYGGLLATVNYTQLFQKIIAVA